MGFRSKFSSKFVEFLIRYKYAAVSAMATASCLLSFFLFKVTTKNMELELTAEFQNVCHNHFESIQNRVASKLNVLKAINAFYSSSQFVERDEFESFVNPFLAEHSGIRKLGYAHLVKEDEKPEFLKSSRLTIDPSFQIWGLESLDKPSDAKPAGQSLPILYLEPLTGDSKVFGYDLNSDLEISKTLESSYSQNKIIAGNY